MSLENKSRQISSSIKEEYLPPPLEENYLSLFDIQVKMTKQFITGTEEEKNLAIKKRIKKFFDYGNQDQQDITFDGKTRKASQNTPFQIDKTKIKENLKFDSSKIILYGEESITFEGAEQMFPGFMGFEKIDDCNVKLSFSSKEECQTLLIKNSKDKSTFTTEHIIDPFEIQWFQLQNPAQDGEEKPKRYYARFVTNKDNILFGNDKYFRKLLGKARQLIDKREYESQQRQKQIQETVDFNKSRAKEKRKFITKSYGQKKYRKDFDTQTNYDGVYMPRKSHKGYENSRQALFFKSREEPFFSDHNDHRERQYFNKLDISEIRARPIELEEYSERKNSRSRQYPRSSSRDSADFSDSFHQRQRPEFQQVNSRDQLIHGYRERQFQNGLKKRNFCQFDNDNREMGRKERKRF